MSKEWGGWEGRGYVACPTLSQTGSSPKETLFSFT